MLTVTAPQRSLPSTLPLFPTIHSLYPYPLKSAPDWSPTAVLSLLSFVFSHSLILVLVIVSLTQNLLRTMISLLNPFLLSNFGFLMALPDLIFPNRLLSLYGFCREMLFLLTSMSHILIRLVILSWDITGFPAAIH